MAAPRASRVALRRDFTGDREVDGGAFERDRFVRSQNQAPMSGGVLIDKETGAVAGSGLAFTAGVARSIAHGLGRKARFFLELYGVDVPSAARCNLYPTAMPAGITSDTHITVTPGSSGTCFLVVY